MDLSIIIHDGEKRNCKFYIEPQGWKVYNFINVLSKKIKMKKRINAGIF